MIRWVVSNDIWTLIPHFPLPLPLCTIAFRNRISIMTHNLQIPLTRVLSSSRGSQLTYPGEEMNDGLSSGNTPAEKLIIRRLEKLIIPWLGCIVMVTKKRKREIEESVGLTSPILEQPLKWYNSPKKMTFFYRSAHCDTRFVVRVTIKGKSEKWTREPEIKILVGGRVAAMSRLLKYSWNWI